MRLGIDCDGVLANYNEGFQRRIITVTGRDLFPCPNYEPDTWYYAEKLGYTAEEIDATWRTIKEDRAFWFSLHPYRDTSYALGLISDRISHTGDDVYFITARPGRDAKKQTEMWISSRFPHLTRPTVTVLLTPHKGLAAQTLGLDAYIDDRWENCLEVAGGDCRTFLMDRPWNQGEENEEITRVPSIKAMFEHLAAPAVGASVRTSRLNTSAA